jgi:hypothetical protein
MSKPERAGLGIVAAVVAYTVVGFLFTWGSWVVAAAHAPQRRNWPTEILSGAAAFLVLFQWGRALWRGQEGARWLGALVLVIVGVSSIWLAGWFTQLSEASERRALIAQAVAAQGMVAPGVAAPAIAHVAVSLEVAGWNAPVRDDEKAFRRGLWWRDGGLGILTVLAGVALLLPPVGQFLRKRRTRGAEPAIAADRGRPGDAARDEVP